MKLQFGTNNGFTGNSVKDIDGFVRYQRFIVLSSVTSKTIPNILDLFFSLTSGDIDTIMNGEQKTRVIVINTSEVMGSIHGIRNTRNRNVYIHHGMADCNVDRIRGDTLIRFTDMDYNVISDKPWDIGTGPSFRDIGEVNLSYDADMFNNVLYRDKDRYTPILTPTPEFYDEKDMVLMGGRDVDYANEILENKENQYFVDTSDYSKNLYTLTLNQLIDEHTQVMKLNIQVDNLTSDANALSMGDNFDNTAFNSYIEDMCCQIKYAMEKQGFSSAEIILNGKNGYNVTDLKSYMNLNNAEKKYNFEMLCWSLNDLNELMFNDIDNPSYSIMIKVDYSNIKVVIVDFIPIGRTINKTDTNVKELGSILKTDSSDMGGGPYAYDSDLTSRGTSLRPFIGSRPLWS